MKIKEIQNFEEVWPKPNFEYHSECNDMIGICSNVQITCDPIELVKIIEAYLKDHDEMDVMVDTRDMAQSLSTQLSKHIRLGKG